MKIAVIGLGFVGLSFASVLGSKLYHTIGIDSDKNKISKIKSGVAPFYEPKLQKTLSQALNKSLLVSSDIEIVIKNCDLIFVTVGTPQSKNGYIDLKMLTNVIKQLGNALVKTKNKPIIIIKSTVVPGTTQNIVKPILEKSSGKLTGIGFSLITNPEFLREGNAVDDTIKPHAVIIGGDDDNAIRKVKQFYRSLYNSKIPIILTNYQTAEMIKYANNSFLATKVSFINQIANICQSIPGTNVDEVAKAIGLDPRIGNLFLKAGPGFGGSCLPKDLQTIITFSSKVGSNPLLLEAVKQTNEFQIKNIMRLIQKLVGNLKQKNITVLGLSFKENSDDIRDSVSIKLIRLLLTKNALITVYDPKAMKNTKKIFNNKIKYANNITDSLKNSHCAIIMTPWKQFSRLNNTHFKNMKRKLIIDTRRILTNKNSNIEYYALGIGNNLFV
jgi:UDPglucose 6-dehydrogenase